MSDFTTRATAALPAAHDADPAGGAQPGKPARPHLPAVRPVTTVHSGDNDLPPRALYSAQLLIGAVRDNTADGVAHVLGDLDRQALLDLSVTLAALVPYDATIRDLLAWNDDGWHVTRRTERRLRPHGTHAAFTRHKKRGDDPCADCVIGERTFQRQRQRVRRSS